MTIGARIRQVREQRGLSQETLAKLMGYKDRSSISKIEKGKDDNIYMDTIQKLAEVLNCSPLFLMGWDKEEKTNESDILEKAAADIQKAVNKSMSEEDKQLQVFTGYYKKLNPEQRTLVDNMITVFLAKQ